MTLLPAHRIGLSIAALIFAADQALKWLVTGPLALGEIGQSLTLLPIFNFTYAENNGVSLNLFSTDSELGRWLLVALTATIAIVVTVWMLRERHRADIAALGLVLGGALGNILDRARLGFVVDYADLHFGEWRPFLIFNLADSAITFGILIILARSFLSREKRADPATQPASDAAEI
ncbi:MAG TPA: signal peptidase II [Novosphingobium sp.]|nr:signal peptidase II [Novosphingobium sp.]